MRTILTATAVALLVGASPAAAQSAAGDAVAAMQAGKASFEKNCRLCHGLDRSLAKRDTAAGWLQTVKRMVSYGAPVASAERPQVVRYLAARSSFAGTCGACHDATRVVPDEPVARDWRALTARMGEHLGELRQQGKAPAGVEPGPKDLEEIAAFLQVVIPQ